MASSEVYRWVDDNGQVHYGNVPPALQEPYRPGVLSEDEKVVNEVYDGSKAKPQGGKNTPVKQGINTQNQPVKNKDNDIHKQETQIEEEKKSEKDDKSKEVNKEQDKNRKKIRNEKLDSLINRLKKDLSSIPVKEKTEPQIENIQLDKKNNPANTESEKIGSVKEKSDVEKEKLGVKKEKQDVKKEKQSVKKEKQDVRKDKNKDKNNSNKEASKSSINKTGPKDKAKEDMEIKKEIESVENAAHTDTDLEKCGFFKSYVENYTDRIKYECPSEHCDLLKRKLEKYEHKVKQYCGEN